MRSAARIAERQELFAKFHELLERHFELDIITQRPAAFLSHRHVLGQRQELLGLVRGVFGFTSRELYELHLELGILASLFKRLKESLALLVGFVETGPEIAPAFDFADHGDATRGFFEDQDVEFAYDLISREVGDPDINLVSGGGIALFELHARHVLADRAGVDKIIMNFSEALKGLFKRDGPGGVGEEKQGQQWGEGHEGQAAELTHIKLQSLEGFRGLSAGYPGWQRLFCGARKWGRSREARQAPDKKRRG